MEEESGYEISLGYCQNRKLRIDFSKKYNRTAHEDEKLEESIEMTWASRQEENASLFNGTKFRFAGMETEGDVCTLLLGLTDYKTYVGTHSVRDAKRKFGERCMGQPVGNVVIPETVDGRTVLLVRSSHTGEGVGGVVFPGGHPEPDMIKGLQEGDVRVEREVWEGARREVMEELWIGDDEVGKIEDMEFLGLVKRRVDGKVSMVFSVRIELSGEQVMKRFGERNDGLESDRIIMMKTDDIGSVTGDMVDGMKVVEETGGAACLWIERREAGRLESRPAW